MGSTKRHLLAGLRKSLLCRFGCKGWCTLYCIWEFIKWSLESMSAGRFPLCRVFGEDWTDSDGYREGLAGMECVREALVHIKNDMMELVTSFGFASWASAAAPCIFGHAGLDNLYNFAGFRPTSSPFALKAQQDTEAAATGCEHWVWVTPELFAESLPCMFYVKRADGARGRALRFTVPSGTVTANERLEPNRLLPDVADFERQRFPCWALFLEKGIRNICPPPSSVIRQPDWCFTRYFCYRFTTCYICWCVAVFMQIHGSESQLRRSIHTGAQEPN